MSELIRRNALMADARAAADAGHHPDQYLAKYEFSLRSIWLTEYYLRQAEIEKQKQMEEV